MPPRSSYEPSVSAQWPAATIVRLRHGLRVDTSHYASDAMLLSWVASDIEHSRNLKREGHNIPGIQKSQLLSTRSIQLEVTLSSKIAVTAPRTSTPSTLDCA